MKAFRSSARAFTLLEVILAMGLSFFLMASLYQAISLQSRFAEVSQSEVRRPLLARTLLHRIADEIRSLPTPPGPLEAAPKARALLSQGETTTAPATELENAVPKVERFALLGTNDRLLLRTVRPRTEAAELIRSDEEKKKDASNLDRKQERPKAPGDLQICFYLLKPVPEKKLEETAEQVLKAEKEGDLETVEPLFQGLIRQEILNPFALDAFAEAKAQLEPLLSPPKEGEVEKDAEKPDRKESAAADVVSTRVVAEDVTAIRFRYHDGAGWRDRWEQVDKLPVAVEIMLSFDPRAGDPEFLKESTTNDTTPAEPTASDESAAAPSSPPGEEEAEPLFPYRLVVAVPNALRPERTPEPDRFGRPPAPPGDLESAP